MSSAPNAWLLLAEDDLLFSKLFERFWMQSRPEVELVTVTSVREARSALASRKVPPIAAVLDFNLKDGTSEEFLSDLNCPTILWSACSESEHGTKPQGKVELILEIDKIARLGGLDVPPQ